MTYTVATLEIHPRAYGEIRKKLEEAGYSHAFMRDGEIDMSGIAIKASLEDPSEFPCPDDCVYKDVPHKHALGIIGGSSNPHSMECAKQDSEFGSCSGPPLCSSSSDR